MCKKSNFKHAPCPTCQGSVVGRSDKVFCSVQCKNKHHSVANAQIKSYFGELKGRLKRNMIVLEGLVGRKKNNAEIHRSALFKKGFDFKTCTSAFRKERKLYFEVGNYLFSFLKEGIVQITRQKELSEKMPVFFRRWEVDFPSDMDVSGSSTG